MNTYTVHMYVISYAGRDVLLRKLLRQCVNLLQEAIQKGEETGKSWERRAESFHILTFLQLDIGELHEK